MLQGQFGEKPLAFTFASAQTFVGASQATPWPIEARLNLADLKLNIEGEIIPATATEDLELDAQLQGETIETLAQLLDTDLPEAGPYQFSFHTQYAEGNYTFSELKGTIERVGPWQMIRVDRGKASVNEKGSVEASIDARFDNAPLPLTFKGGPGAPDENGKKVWPLKLEASASGATIKGDGAVVTTDEREGIADRNAYLRQPL